MFMASPPIDHGKSRSSIFHISSFTRRIEIDICSNYPTAPLPHTYLIKALIDGLIHHSFIRRNMNDAEAILAYEMGCFRNWGKGETGRSKFMPTVWHHTATDFPVINHLNPACAIFQTGN